MIAFILTCHCSAEAELYFYIISFVKTWRVENTGNDAWPEGCRLLHTGGDRLGAEATSAPLLCLPPRTCLDVSVQMVAPGHQGLYSSKWRMTTPQGHFFGGQTPTF